MDEEFVVLLWPQ